MKWNKKKSNGNYIYNGIDRKDNQLDYFFDNCIPACSICNLGKHTKTYEVFIEYLNNLTKYRTKVNASLS